MIRPACRLPPLAPSDSVRRLSHVSVSVFKPVLRFRAGGRSEVDACSERVEDVDALLEASTCFDGEPGVADASCCEGFVLVERGARGVDDPRADGDGVGDRVGEAAGALRVEQDCGVDADALTGAELRLSAGEEGASSELREAVDVLHDRPEEELYVAQAVRVDLAGAGRRRVQGRLCASGVLCLPERGVIWTGCCRGAPAGS